MARSKLQRNFADAAPVLAALGDATRLRVVAQLSSEGPQSIARLAQNSEITRQGVTKHLKVLEDAGVVRSSRQGRENVYELAPGRLTEVQRLLTEISEQWDGALLRLRAFVEKDV